MFQENTDRIFTRLLDWYDSHSRELPWRVNRDPYRIWVSEIMLQQTRVEAVRPYYERFLEALPTLHDLAECEPDRLMKLWEGLGYYSRVRNMQLAARQAEEWFGGELPDDRDQLLRLQGIGDYTAGAIASIAFDRPVPAVDGNVVRIMSRLNRDGREMQSLSYRKSLSAEIGQAMERYFAEGARSPGALNQALMDLGAGICLPGGRPLCETCPLADLCEAHLAGKETDFPVRAPKKTRRREERTVLLVRDGERIALSKRPGKGLLAGMYEFPNVEGHRSEEEALVLVRETGLEPLYIRRLKESRHIFSHVEWQMIGYEIRVSSFAESDRWILTEISRAESDYALPAAFGRYKKYLSIRTGPGQPKDGEK